MKKIRTKEIFDRASNEDLDPLVQYIMKTSTESLSADDDYKKYFPNHQMYSDRIFQEIKSFGGNTLANIFRSGEGPKYREIVNDVAKKFKIGNRDDSSLVELEGKILSKSIEEVYEKSDDREKHEIEKALKKAGLSKKDFRSMLSGGSLAANTVLTRSLPYFLGPVGGVISGLWAAYDISGPAYRVTVPCVIHIAQLRLKYMCEDDVSDIGDFPNV